MERFQKDKNKKSESRLFRGGMMESVDQIFDSVLKVKEDSASTRPIKKK
ncbi:hypothetical protein [Bacillus sp. REN3]|nr:hypothetical protein [Bacillus sp. REN3]